MNARVYLPAGFTLTELVFAMSLSLVLVGVALPIGGGAFDDMRARGAVRYLAGRIGGGRFAAINRSACGLGSRFTTRRDLGAGTTQPFGIDA